MEKNSSPSPDHKDTRSLYIDERTQKKIHEHLNNEDDIITEQDIANVTTGVVMENESINLDVAEDNIEEIEENRDKDIEDKKIKSNEEADIDTPWNILGS